ncbi:S8 family serine peptidase [Streptomyces fagopyri]|uniref:S8 family serine peptidase n=1 Tax=Streptomyces fagopyri TaxID=2662397 RepID=A0A5Q0LAG9_9ACTN|nr:S8 family serine peptidase [Streptomyces fagopyri]QFZ73911.1 S8 family serine peptidase [Streptomyces fagopyri]
MVSGISRDGRRTASSAGRNGRRVFSVCAALGAVVVVPAGLAPGAAADDVRSKQWYLAPMKASEMWKVSAGEGVKVAVIDSGVNPGTPSLKGQVLVDEVPKAVSYHVTQDYSGHGTSMAELIAGTGAGGGLKGLAPGARIVPYRIVTGDLKSEAERMKTSTSAMAIRAAADSDAKIINMSYGSPASDPDEEAAIKYAHSKGKLLIAGTGNNAEKFNLIGYPAAYPFVVGVAAADKTGKVGKFSEHGNYVDLAAPGLDLPVWCDKSFRSYCTGAGTSAATAITSASAALVWSAHPDWTANQVLGSLIDTAGRDWPKNKPSNYLGYGLIRPRKVLEDTGIDPGPAKTDPLSYENGAGVTGASPSATAPASSQPPKSTSGDRTSAAGSNTESSGGTPWGALAGVAAVLVIAGGAFAVIRSRRRA